MNDRKYTIYFEGVTTACMATSQWNEITYLKTDGLRTELQHFDEIFPTLNDSFTKRPIDARYNV